MAPVQVSGPVLTVRRVDAYHALTMVAPAIATDFRPGQFVTIAVGGPESSMLLRRNGVRAKIVRKHSDGPGPDGEPTVVTRILDGEMDLIVNTPFGSPGHTGPRLDGYEIRSAAVRRGVPCVTTVPGLGAAVQGIEATIRGEVGVRSLQEHAERMRDPRSDLGH